MKKRQLVNALAGIGLGLAISTTANALIPVFSPIWGFQDDDIEFIFDVDNSGTITTGDRFLAVGEISNTNGIFPGQDAPITGEELTFIGAAVVTVVADSATTSHLEFSPDPAGVLINAGFDANTTVVAWRDATPDLNVLNGACGTQAQCTAAAGLGGGDGSVVFASFGFGDPDDNWATPSLPNSNLLLAGIEGAGANTIIANFNFYQSILINNTGVQLAENTLPCFPDCGAGGDGFVDARGSGSLLGGVGLNHDEWSARSDADFEVAPLQVPEPGSLALMGAALAGAAMFRRRKVS